MWGRSHDPRDPPDDPPSLSLLSLLLSSRPPVCVALQSKLDTQGPKNKNQIAASSLSFLTPTGHCHGRGRGHGHGHGRGRGRVVFLAHGGGADPPVLVIGWLKCQWLAQVSMIGCLKCP